MGNWLITELRFLGITLLTGGCYGYLAQKFMKRTGAGRLVGIAYIAAALYYLLPVFSNFTAYCLLTLVGFLVMYGLERENAAQKLFLSVTFFSLRWLVMAMEQCAAQPVYQRLYTVSAAKPEVQAAAWITVRFMNVPPESALWMRRELIAGCVFSIIWCP